jgi:hypothetical protein
MNSFLTALKMAYIGAISWLTPSNLVITQLDLQNLPVVQNELQAFEKQFVYPFSATEQFRIQHGMAGDYLGFFKQLGTPHYYVARCKHTQTVTKKIEGKTVSITHKAGEIAAVCCAVLRTMPTKDGKKIPAWYLCDLKVAPAYQHEHIPITLFMRLGIRNFIQCPRGFGICMNPETGDPKAALIFKKHAPLKGLQSQVLNLYTLSAEQLTKQYDALECLYKKHGKLAKQERLTFKSTSGFKDYVILNKNGMAYPWQLFHGQAGDVRTVPTEGATFMLAALDETAFDTALKKLVGKPSSTAQIVSYGMENVDFNCLTSNHI